VAYRCILGLLRIVQWMYPYGFGSGRTRGARFACAARWLMPALSRWRMAPWDIQGMAAACACMQNASNDKKNNQTCSLQYGPWPLSTVGMQQRKVCCIAWLTCTGHGCSVKLGVAQTGGADGAHAAGTWPSSPAAGTPARTASRAPAAPCTRRSRPGRRRRLWRRRARRRTRRGSLAARMLVSGPACGVRRPSVRR